MMIKKKVPLFVESPEGILMLQEDIGGCVNDKYTEKITRFKNRLTKEGRYIYDISYQRYVLEHALKNNEKS